MSGLNFQVSSQSATIELLLRRTRVHLHIIRHLAPAKLNQNHHAVQKTKGR